MESRGGTGQVSKGSALSVETGSISLDPSPLTLGKLLPFYQGHPTVRDNKHSPALPACFPHIPNPSKACTHMLCCIFSAQTISAYILNIR